MLKKLLSFLFLFAFILSMSNTSSVFAAPQRKTIKKPSSILRNYANKMEQKESEVTKKQQEKTKAIEKARQERQQKLEEQKKASEEARKQRQQNIQNIKDNANSLKNSFKLK